MGHICFIGIGSNLGDKTGNCKRAVSEILRIDGHRLLRQSSLYRTRPFGYTSQDWFVNGVVKAETPLEPPDLLRSLKAIELRLGRGETFRWGPRVIDLDILLFDDVVLESEKLRIPHPHLHERQFVLAPLAEIDPFILHPTLKRTVRDLLAKISEDQGVERLEEPLIEGR